MDIKVKLLQGFTNFFIKKTSVGTTMLAWSETLATQATRTMQNKSAVKNENMPNKELAEKLH